MVGKTLEQRFWEKVDQSGGPEACWPWMASRKPSGYGRFAMGSKVDGTNRIEVASRVAFYLEHGYWPLVVRHACDNPPCCNPIHLRPGDHADNVRDAIDRGRFRHWNNLKTHCKRGHPLSGTNVYRRSDGARGCHACDRETSRAFRERNPRPKAQPKTHCKRGHPFDPENTYTWRGMRKCRACHRALTRRRSSRQLESGEALELVERALGRGDQ